MTKQEIERTIWDTLFAAIGNPYGVAGLMGNLYAESALNPQNLQSKGNTALGMTDAEYTAAVDGGEYPGEQFIHDRYGYGIAQWTYSTRKLALFAYATAAGTSIGDLGTQLGFLLKEIKGYTKVWKTLLSAKTVREASDAVLTGYEKSANQSDAVKAKRAGYGQTYLEKFYSTNTTDGSEQAATQTADGSGQQTASPTEEDNSMRDRVCTPDAVIAVAINELGYQEKKSNASLDDKTANAGTANYTKYARDFDKIYTSWFNGKKNGFAWCSVFVSWCFLTAFGYETALKLLCLPEKNLAAGCRYALRYFNNKGQFHTSNPQPGDQIFFGESLSSVSHTGLVEKVEGGKVHTIEGNTSNMVKRRSYDLSYKRILGYGRPAYSATSSQSTAAPTKSTTPAQSTTAQPGNSSYQVRVKIKTLNYRRGPSTSYSSYGHIRPGIYTVVEEKAGWGRLQEFDNAWICLKYAVKVG